MYKTDITFVVVEKLGELGEVPAIAFTYTHAKSVQIFFDLI